MAGSKYSVHAIYDEGEPVYEAFECRSSSGTVLDHTIQNHPLAPDDCDQFIGPEAGTIDNNVLWDFLGEFPLECWENGSSYGPNWMNTGIAGSQQGIDISDTIARYPTEARLMSPPYSDYRHDPSVGYQLQIDQMNQLCETPMEAAHGYSSGCTFPGSYQLRSLTFSAPLLPPDGLPSSLTPDSSQSPDATTSTFNSSLHDQSDEDNKEDTEPYAKLIYRALLSAPNHSMVLKDIYKWFENHTTKTNSQSKGWQNSIRHNLSMNGGFKKTQQSSSTGHSNKGWVWVLDPLAIENGIESTTRYRRHASGKKSGKSRQHSKRQMPRLTSPKIKRESSTDDHISVEILAQHSTLVDSSPIYPFSGRLARSSMNGDYSANRQLAELSPYYSLPGSPINLIATREREHYPTQDLQSYGMSFNGDTPRSN